MIATKPSVLVAVDHVVLRPQEYFCVNWAGKGSLLEVRVNPDGTPEIFVRDEYLSCVKPSSEWRPMK